MPDNVQNEQLLQLHSNLHRFLKTIKNNLRNQFKSLGISGNQVRILRKFTKIDKIYIKTLLQKLQIKKGNLSRLVDKLVKDGLIIRGRDEDDRRKVYVTLTSKGKHILEIIVEQEIEFAQKLYQNIPPERIPVFLNLFNELQSYLEVGL